jgi:hypothetical protein
MGLIFCLTDIRKTNKILCGKKTSPNGDGLFLPDSETLSLIEVIEEMSIKFLEAQP